MLAKTSLCWCCFPDPDFLEAADLQVKLSLTTQHSCMRMTTTHKHLHQNGVR